MKRLARVINGARIGYARFMSPRVLAFSKRLEERTRQAGKQTDNEYLETFLLAMADGFGMGAVHGFQKNARNIALYEKYIDSLLADLWVSRDLTCTYKRFWNNCHLGMNPNEAMLDWIDAAIAYPEELPEPKPMDPDIEAIVNLLLGDALKQMAKVP